MIPVCMSSLNINNNMSLQANNPQDSLLSGRFRRKQIFSKGRNKAHLAATAVLKLPCHKHRTTGFSFLLLQRQKAIAPLKFHWVFFFCFAETDTSLDRVLSPAKSHGSKRCSMQLFLHLFGPVHEQKDQRIKLSGLAATKPGKTFPLHNAMLSV